MSKRAIARALKTKAAQAGSGAASFVQSSSALTSYGAWNAGSGSTGSSLPRGDVFSSGSFSPLNPIMPIGIDKPDADSGRAAPRRMQYPVGYNMPVGQPGSEGLKLVSFANLRMYADAYSVVRACIQVRKEEILGLDWDIVPTDEAQREMRGNADLHEDFQKRRAEALNFFKRPDPNYHDFTGWMGAVLEDVLVVDALSVYIHPPRVAGKGVLGSDLAALEVLDGTTIRPLLDVRGGSPRPPYPSYQQYLWGVPRTDMMDIILQSDIEEMDEPVAEYRADQLLYLPYTRRSWTPYGFPGIERAIIPVMTGLRRQRFQLEFFSEGSIPGQFVVPGEDISTPSQVRQLQDTLNAISGDQAWKHKIIVLPRGSTTKDQKPLDLGGDFDSQLVTAICMAYDVMPMELGINPGSGGGGQTPQATNQMAQASAEISRRKALKPMLNWLKSAIFDHVLQDIFKQDDMQWAWMGLESVDDEESKAANFKTLTAIGLLSIDEARVQMGLSPWGLPLTSDPVYMSATGVSTLGTIDPATAESYFNEAPIASPDTLTTQPQGQAIGSAPPSAGASAPAPGTPTASAGLPAAGGRPTGGGGGAPTVQAPRGNSTTPPLHPQAKATQKALTSEFDALRRHIKKGRSLDAWNHEFISVDAMNAIKKTFTQTNDLSASINTGKNVMKFAERLARRNDVVQHAASDVMSALGSLASNIKNASVGPVKFIDQGVEVLRSGYLDVMQNAAQHASDDHTNVSSIVPGGFEQLAAERAEKQRPFLTGMAHDVLAGQSDAKLRQRINLYARSLIPAYEQAYGLAVLTGQAIGNGAIKKRRRKNDLSADDSTSQDDAYIDDSSDYEDETASEDVASPSDGEGFNGWDALIALAGAAIAEYLLTDLQTPEGDMTGDDQPTDFAEQPRSVIVWHATGSEPCDLCDERDGEEYTLDTLPCWPGDGGFGEFCDGAGNCNCYLEYIDPQDAQSDMTADNPISDYTNTFYAQRAAEENALDAQATDIRNADIAAVAQDSPDAAARMQQRDALYGVPGTRYGPGGNYDPFADVTASASPDLTKSVDDEHFVYKALDATTFYALSIDDVVVNPADEVFETERPDAEHVAIVKFLDGTTLPANAELQVMRITPDEVEFFVL